jgi:ribose 5-phosphate isomerase B
MKIALASDHAGHDLKVHIASFLCNLDVPYADFGCGPGEQVDYPDYGAAAARAVLSGECDRAILVCGTGLGMALTANKFKGILAVPCATELAAEMSRRHNDANVLTLGGRTTTPEEAEAIVRVWLNTPFEGGRHARRVQKIRDIEAQNFR